MTTVTMTKKSKLLKALREGEQMTAKDITSRFGLANPSATISELRFDGFAIYGNQVKTESGTTVVRYRLGAPSRAIVAAGIRSLADQGISI